MSNLLVRIMTAIIGGAIVISLIIYSAYGLWLLGFVVSMVALFEFLRGMGIGKREYLLPAGIMGTLVWLMVLFDIPDTMTIGAMMLILPVFEVLTLFNQQESRPHIALGTVTLGFFYCYIPLLLFFKLAAPDTMADYDHHLPLGILILNWTLDSTAYLFGKYLGKTPLYPRISPKKTWEGAIGGTLCCLIMGAILSNLMPMKLPEGPTLFPTYHWLVAAILIAVFSQLGDLVESMFKRSVSLKDSGKVLPGHGGMLDRFDGLFLSTPFLYFYFLML